VKHQGKPYPLFVVAIMLTPGLVAFGVYNQNRMPASPYPGIHGAFSLHSVDGPVTSRDMREKVGIIYFGYTHCPDVCPATLLNVGAALKLLTSEELSRVAPVFITTDGANHDKAAGRLRMACVSGTGGYCRLDRDQGHGFTAIYSSQGSKWRDAPLPSLQGG